MDDLENDLEKAIEYFDSLIDENGKKLTIIDARKVPVSLEYLKFICKSIGCSMIDEKCPGNTSCDIIRKFLRR